MLKQAFSLPREQGYTPHAAVRKVLSGIILCIKILETCWLKNEDGYEKIQFKITTSLPDLWIMTFSHGCLSGVAKRSGSSLLWAGVTSLKPIFCDTVQFKGDKRLGKKGIKLPSGSKLWTLTI